jgi:hypothetical protein
MDVMDKQWDYVQTVDFGAGATAKPTSAGTVQGVTKRTGAG